MPVAFSDTKVQIKNYNAISSYNHLSLFNYHLILSYTKLFVKPAV